MEKYAQPLCKKEIGINISIKPPKFTYVKII